MSIYTEFLVSVLSAHVQNYVLFAPSVGLVSILKLEAAAIVKFMTLSACQHVGASGVIVKYPEASGHYVM